MYRTRTGNQRHFPFVRDRQIREAGRWIGHRPHGRIGRPCHGVRVAESARGHRLPSPDGRLQGIHLRVGPHPGRLLQARRQAVRKGSPDQPRDRSPDPAAVPRRAGATSRRLSRSCCRPMRTTTRTCSRSAAPLQRSRCRAFLSRRRSPACAWARSRGSTSSTRPTSSEGRARSTW